MNKIEFLHMVEASATEMKEIIREARSAIKLLERDSKDFNRSINERKARLDRAERHLNNLYSIIDILYKNLPDKLLDK